MFLNFLIQQFHEQQKVILLLSQFGLKYSSDSPCSKVSSPKPPPHIYSAVIPAAYLRIPETPQNLAPLYPGALLLLGLGCRYVRGINIVG